MAKTPDDIVERLGTHRMFSEAPRHEHEWLAARGVFKAIRAGEVANAKLNPGTAMLILLKGHVVMRVDRGAGSHKIIEWRGGEVGGLLPYSRGVAPPNDAIAEEDSEYFEVDKVQFPEMIRECPVCTAKVVHAMLDRARIFAASDMRDEKLVSLGKLAAGLAHELNNPASAASRAAKFLTEAQTAADEAARRLGAAGLDAAQLAALDCARGDCASSDPGHHLSGLERADREDAITDWLTRHGASAESAGALAETAITIAQLDALAASIKGPALDAATRWLAAGCAVRSLAAAIETSAARISDIVAAVKGFTYMDQAPNAGAVDIRQGIADAITMLGAKVRAKGAEVTVDFATDLPMAHAVGAELNQVWMNLIDNALDAVATKGIVRVAARKELEKVVVEVIDDGSGIPKEILGRIFEPFYTTKGVGKGTGLGLDIVRRLLQRQEGSIDAESVPGRTVFRVLLPMSKEKGEAALPRPPRSSLVRPAPRPLEK